jgi:hypothetical protein
MTPLGGFLKKWWLPVAIYLLATAPSGLALLAQNSLTPLLKQIAIQQPERLLQALALLLLLVLLLFAFSLLQHPWLRWDEPTGTWVNRINSLRYCAKCKTTKVITPLKKEVTGWRCMNCHSFFHNEKLACIQSLKKRVNKNERY